jgi:membrane protein DedA with SNARE-associated domain
MPHGLFSTFWKDSVILDRVNFLDHIVKLFQAYGYWIVFFGVMLENAGLPVPGETILLAAGFCASQGTFSLTAVIGIAAVGAMTGDNASYWIGHELGRNFLLRYGKYFLLTQKRFDQMENFFHRHGDKTVLVARFISGFRVFTALFAGASHMVWRRFLLFNILGAVIWATTIALLGYFFGQNWALLTRRLDRTALTVLVIVIALFVLRRWFKARQLRRGPQP